MKHYFIVNPAAGSGKNITALTERIEKVCRERLTDFEIYVTKAVGDATDFVRRTCESAKERLAENGENLRFYSCGGDGTNNEVISGAVEYDFAEVGFIPDGTGNDFIRCFNSPERFTDIGAQLDSRAEAIDLISCNEKYIMNIMNMGFDCEVVRQTAKLKKLPLVSKSLAYILGVVVELVRKPGTKLKVALDGGKTEEKELLLATFSNGRYYGGGFRSSPKARLCDGLMDVCFIKNVSRRKFVSIVGKYKSGEYIDMKELASIVEFRRCKTADLEFDGAHSVCIDGEILDNDRFKLRLLPRALKILIPKGSSFAEDELSAPDPVLATV